MKKALIRIFTFVLCASILFSVACSSAPSVFKDYVVSPTCTTGGFTVMSDGSTTETKPALGHNNALIETVDSTCFSSGRKVYKCSRCGDFEIEEIAKKEHNYVTALTVPATCTDHGYTLQECEHCMSTKKINPVQSQGHGWEDVPDGALSYGAKKVYCDDCESYAVQTSASLESNGFFDGSNFESVEVGNSLDGWDVYGGYTPTVVTDTTRNSKVLKLERSIHESDLIITSPAFPVVEGKPFNFSFDYLAGDYWNRARVSLSFFDKDFNPMSGTFDYVSDINLTAWTEIVSEKYVVPTGAQFCVVQLKNAGFEGTISYFDNVKFNYVKNGVIEQINRKSGFTNSDFETFNENGLIGWDYYMSDSTNVQLSKTVFDSAGNIGSHPTSGEYCLYIDCRDKVEKGVISPLLKISAGANYVITANAIHYYSYGVVKLKVDFYTDQTCTENLATYTHQIAGREANVWSQLEIDCKAPLNARYLTVTLLGSSECRAFFDDVKVVEQTKENITLAVNDAFLDNDLITLKTLLNSQVLGLVDCNVSNYLTNYNVAFNQKYEELGRDLSYEEIQAIILSVNSTPENYPVDASYYNLGLENNNGANFDGWELYHWGDGVVSASSDYYCEGTQSLKISKTSGTTQFFSALIPVEVGELYYFSAETLSIGWESSASVSISLWSDKNTQMYSNVGSKQAHDYWSTVGVLVQIPEDCLYIKISFGMPSECPECTVYFDDLFFAKVDKEDLTDEFNRLLDQDNKYQVRSMLNMSEWISTGFRFDRLEEYIYKFKKIKAETGRISYQQIIDTVKSIDAEPDVNDMEMLNDISAQVGKTINLNDTGFVSLPEDLSSICDEYFIQINPLSDGLDTEYFKILNNKIYLNKRPASNAENETFNLKIAISLNNSTKVIDYTVHVQKWTKVEETLDMINFDLIKGENISSTQIHSDVVLPNSINGLNVNWSTDSEYLTSLGKYLSVPYGVTVPVTLTATVEGGYTKNIGLMVVSDYVNDLTEVPVENASFEEGVDNWYLYSNFGKFEPSKEQVYDGVYSFKAIPADHGMDICMAFVNGLFDVTEGRRYTAQVMCYATEEQAWPGMFLEFYNYQGALVDSISVEYDYTNLSTWQLLSVSYVAPTSAVSMKVMIYSCARVAYFDCLSVYKHNEIDNGEFELGLKAWNVNGGVAIENGYARLANGASLQSNPVYKAGKSDSWVDGVRIDNSQYRIGYQVKKNVDYLVSAEISGRVKIEVIFDNGSIIEETFDNATAKPVLMSYTPPVGAYSCTVKFTALTDGATVDNVDYDVKSYGTQIVDGSFEGDNRYWTFNNASVTESYATDGVKGVEIQVDGKIVSHKIPVYAGKTYYLTLDVKDGAESSIEAKITYYDKWSAEYGTDVHAEPNGDRSYQNLSLNYVGERATTTFIPKVSTCYAVLEFYAVDSSAVIDNINIHAISSSVSNYNFEALYDVANAVENGAFPYQWMVDGELSVSATTSLYSPDGVVAVALKGNGTFKSSYVQALEGVVYEASVYAKEIKGNANLSIGYYDAEFNRIGGSENVAITASEWQRVIAFGETVSNTAYYRLEVTVDGFVVIDKAFSETKVRNVEGVTQTFYDDWIIESTDMERVAHQAEISDYFNYNTEANYQKYGATFYGTVLYDEDEEIYKMWYLSRTDVDTVGYGQNYATSKDGVNWEYPNLGLVDFMGNTDNNYLWGRYAYHALCVVKDYDEPNPNRRYKMTYFLMGIDGVESAYYIGYSADGITINEQTEILRYRDVITSAYDEVNGVHILIAKCMTERREHSVMFASDFDDFKSRIPIKLLSSATPIDGLHCFNPESNDISVYSTNNTYIALSNVIMIEEQNHMRGVTNVKLLFSRDLTEDWQRPTYEDMLTKGPLGTYQYGFHGISNSWVETEDTVSVYMSGSLGGQHIPRYEGGFVDMKGSAMHTATWRKDGFTSMRADGNGTLTTALFNFDGNGLKVNADVTGSLQIEILDENGNVIEGFDKDSCNVITGDSVKHQITFDGSDLSSLAGRNVKLKFYVNGADLYSFTVQQ